MPIPMPKQSIHLHCLVLDGVYRRGADGTPEFVEVAAPTDEVLQAVLHRIITRLMKLLTRRGVLVEEEGSTYIADNDGDSDEARTLRPLQVAACTYRIAFGPRAGQKVLTVQGAMPRQTEFKQSLCVTGCIEARKSGGVVQSRVANSKGPEGPLLFGHRVAMRIRTERRRRG